MMASRRFSRVDGRFAGDPSDIGVETPLEAVDLGVPSAREGEGSGEVLEGGKGFEESANRRVWKVILHRRHSEGFAEGRRGMRNGLVAEGEAIESKRSLGTTLAKGGMTALLRNGNLNNCFGVGTLLTSELSSRHTK